MHRIVCKNCDKHFQGNYCPECGQASNTHKINSTYFLHDIPHSIFHVDKGFPFTFISLFKRPGYMLKDYLAGKRVKYFRPFGYVVIMSAICTLLITWLNKLIVYYYAQYHNGVAIQTGNGFFEHYFSVFIFLLIPVTSLVTWLTFTKQAYNYWEHFLVNTYLGAQLNVLMLLMKISGLVKLWITKDSPELNISLFMVLFMTLYGFSLGTLMHPSSRGLKGGLRIAVMNAILASLYIVALGAVGIISSPWAF